MADSEQVELAQAFRRQMDQADLSGQVDRTGWTDQQWVDDARERMNHPDGAITSLKNGHVMAMLREITRLDALVDALQADIENAIDNS